MELKTYKQRIALPDPGCEVTGYDLMDDGKLLVTYRFGKGLFPSVIHETDIYLPEEFSNHKGVVYQHDSTISFPGFVDLSSSVREYGGLPSESELKKIKPLTDKEISEKYGYLLDFIVDTLTGSKTSERNKGGLENGL